MLNKYFRNLVIAVNVTYLSIFHEACQSWKVRPQGGTFQYGGHRTDTSRKAVYLRNFFSERGEREKIKKLYFRFYQQNSFILSKTYKILSLAGLPTAPLKSVWLDKCMSKANIVKICIFAFGLNYLEKSNCPYVETVLSLL